MFHQFKTMMLDVPCVEVVLGQDSLAPTESIVGLYYIQFTQTKRFNSITLMLYIPWVNVVYGQDALVHMVSIVGI